MESEAADLQLRNESLEALVQTLMGEMEQAESRRSRDRERLSAKHGSTVVPVAALLMARDTLDEGAAALIAAQEHTLRSLELRLAAMSAQLERCASLLPYSPSEDTRVASPTSPSRDAAHFGFGTDADGEWAEPGLGGLSLDSLPLHVPTRELGASASSGDAYGIHGRRAAISTPSWSEHPGASSQAWWDEGFDREAEESMLSSRRGDELPEVHPPLSLASRTEASSKPLKPTALAGWERDRMGGASSGFREPSAAVLEYIGGGAGELDALPGMRPASAWSGFTQGLTGALQLKPSAPLMLSAANNTMPMQPSHTRGGRRSTAVTAHTVFSGALQPAIAKHPIFASLSPGLRRDAAAACMREVRVKPGQVIAFQGANCDAFCIIDSGVFDGYVADAGPTPVRKFKRERLPRCELLPSTATPSHIVRSMALGASAWQAATLSVSLGWCARAFTR